MNILFICPEFYNYHKVIKNELRTKYDKIYYRKDIPIGISIFHFIRRFVPILHKLLSNLYNQKLLHLIQKKNITRIFIIKGSILSRSFFEDINSMKNKIEIFNYQWDSIKNNPNGILISEYANYNFSFDLNDCYIYRNFTHLPLFYYWIEEYQDHDKFVKDIDVLFVGSYIKERYDIIEKVNNELESLGLNFKKHVYIRYLSYLRHRKKDNIDKHKVSFKKVTEKKYIDYLKRSKIVLDIPSVSQYGATIRTMEALSLGKKLISTNQMLKQEKFFNTQNIMIWDTIYPINIHNLSSTEFDHSQDQYILSLKEWLQQIGL